MTQKHIAAVQPVPSSILHNSTEIRRQHTRAAARQAVQLISRKLQALTKNADAVTAPDMAQMQGGH